MTLSGDLVSDLPTFLDTDEFADSATISKKTVSEATINGIFDNDYFEVNTGQVGVSSSTPAFLCRTSDITNVKFGHVITINSLDYKVRDIQPDGTGMTALILEVQ